MQLSENHISKESEIAIMQLLKPLTKMSGIRYFSYGINFADTSGFTLTTHTSYYEKSIQKQFPLCGFHLNEGWHLWETTLPNEQQQISEELSIGNGIILVKHQDAQTEIVEFAGTVDNRHVYDFYMNNKTLLKKFIHYFTEEADGLIEKAKHQKFIPDPGMVLDKGMQQDLVTTKPAIEEFYNQIDHPQSKLSARELECYLYLIKGYSIAQISNENALAIPTIANYIHRVKQKLQCFTRKEMVQKAFEMGLIDYA